MSARYPVVLQLDLDWLLRLKIIAYMFDQLDAKKYSERNEVKVQKYL